MTRSPRLAAPRIANSSAGATAGSLEMMTSNTGGPSPPAQPNTHWVADSCDAPAAANNAANPVDEVVDGSGVAIVTSVMGEPYVATMFYLIRQLRRKPRLHRHGGADLPKLA